MASVSFAHDQRPPVDQSLEQVGNGASALNKPIRCRLNPDLYEWGGTHYVSWSGLSWIVELQDVSEGRRLRQALTAFFQVFGASEKKQAKLITELQKMAAGARG